MVNQIYTKTIKFLGSKIFFWLIIALFVIQALWVAFSFRYPLPYDEGYHFGLIKIYSHHLSPIITNQPHAYDTYRDLFHEGSHLYHYIMAFPYRLISIFTDVQAQQVVALRILNVAMFAGGLVLFAKLFKKIGIRQSNINVALLFLVLLPMSTLVAATINYDNLLFLLTPIFLIYCAKIIMSKKVGWKLYVGAITVGCIASLVQIEFLVIFIISFIYLLFFAWRKYGKSFFDKFWASIKKSRRRTVALSALILIVSVGLFSQVYVMDTLHYGTPNPGCTATMQKSRCLKNSVISHYINLKATKNQRPEIPVSDFSLTWFKDIEKYITWTAGVNTAGIAKAVNPLPLTYLIVFVASIIGPAVLLYAWKPMPKNQVFYFLVVITIGLVLALFIQNMQSNYRYNQLVAIQTRYLLPVLPIAMVLVTQAISFAFRNTPKFKPALLILVFIIFIIGGGGFSTHILLSQDDWYWQNSKVIKANHAAKKVLHPIVKEGYGKLGF